MIHTDGKPTIAMRESDRQHSVKAKDNSMVFKSGDGDMDYAARVSLERVANRIEVLAADGRMTDIDEAVAFMRAVAEKFA